MRFDNILDDFDFEGNEMPLWADEGEVVAKFFSSIEAELAAARLRSEGVHCFLANATANTVLPHLQTVIRLHVRPNDSAMAREILHEAAIEATITTKSSSSGVGAIIILAVIIGVVLAWMLVKSMSI